jgi:hypothetical protein
VIVGVLGALVWRNVDLDLDDLGDDLEPEDEDEDLKPELQLNPPWE